ncbi:glycine cleavage system aminomethyltransferase GcvT [Actinocorallia sp. API 0066]|uniref:glycine cleavage system aminomethyltransferase GcvT n=1 Tax=Actinocorallia sp. API 0066 TaxID=2896846 RepID=UPI001E633526|nr:glycine cleavage system aminomethyltransferase GcvT [Actinocorallia sp. API 0066]MCD0451409.1 glycine cleavage system aminomethyltransferase GcvT [Actinocorallia sp. API 0066]
MSAQTAPSDGSPQPAARTTPLVEVHRELGGTLVDFAGYLMPLRYGSETAEHHAVRASAGIFDISHMGEIFVTGSQAPQALDHALVGLPSGLDPGRARYTMIVTPDGGVIDDLIVYRLSGHGFLVVANAANAAVVAAELTERAAGFDAVVSDESDKYALIAVQGPKAQEIVQRLTQTDLPALKYYALVSGVVAGHQAFIGRTGYTGEDGFELFVAAEDAEPVWRALTEAGGADLTPCGLSARDTLRLEAGMPLYGHELTRDTTPYDAGLGRVVRLEKPDFVGREALAAIAEAGPAHRLVGLVARGRRVPRAGYTVIGDDGEPCGTVTSGAPSPTLGRPVAMASVRVDARPAAVDIRGKHEEVDVVDLPFYHREHRPAGGADQVSAHQNKRTNK